MSSLGAPVLQKPKFSQAKAAKIYAELRKKITEAGILERDYVYYSLVTFVSFGGFLVSIFFIVSSASILSTIFWSTVFVFFSIQLAGLFHDAGHRAIFKSPKMNDFFGGFVSALADVSYSYWKYKHNKHHASPNELEEDPDIEIPFISFTQRKKMANIFEERLKSYQAYLYFPLGVLALLYFKYKSLSFFRNTPAKYLIWEVPLYIFGLFVWYAAPFLLVPVSHALVFLIFSNLGVGFYLMNIFAPNHKGMPQIENGARFSFLEQQIVTSRDVKSNWFLDILYIGLNYQIEHHLFPNCPRNKLKLIRPYVLSICAKYGFEFSEVSLFETNRIILSELQQIALS